MCTDTAGSVLAAEATGCLISSVFYSESAERAQFAKNKFTNSFIHQNSLDATEMLNVMSYFYFTHHSTRLPVDWIYHVWPTQHNYCYCFCCSRSMNPSFTAKTLLSCSVLCDTTDWHSLHTPSNFALFAPFKGKNSRYFMRILLKS